MIMERVPMAKMKMARIEINKRFLGGGQLPSCLVFSTFLAHIEHLPSIKKISTKLQFSRPKVFPPF